MERNIRKGRSTLCKRHCPTARKISSGVSVGRYRRRPIAGSINLSLSALGKRHCPTTTGIGQTTMVVDFCIGPCLCTSHRGRQVWTSRIDRGLWTQLSARRAFPSPTPFSYTQRTDDIIHEKPASAVTCILFNRHRP